MVADRIGPPGGLVEHFDRLQAEGTTSPVGLSEAEGPRPRTTYRPFLKSMAAACMDILMENGGQTRDQAAHEVARYCCKWPGMGDPTKTTATTIINWRDHLNASTPEERADYQRLREAFRKDQSPLAKVREILRDGPPSGPKT